MEKKILRILLKHYTKISYKGGIAKVIFDDEFEKIAEEIVNSTLVDVSQQRELLIAYERYKIGVFNYTLPAEIDEFLDIQSNL